MCNPIIDATHELDTDSVIQLPLDLAQEYREEIAAGTLIVSISDATLNDKGHLVLLSPFSTCTVIKDDPRYDPHRQRHLIGLTGTQKVAIVRISTASFQQSNSDAQIRDALFGQSAISFVSQLHDCSHGKLTLQNRGIFHIQLPGRNSDYGNDPNVVIDAAMAQIKALGHANDVSKLAARTIFCLPEGFGSWAA